MPSVALSRRFFASITKDYSNWRWALIREFAQNSIDCGSTQIDVKVDLCDGNTRLTFANNGPSMTREVLEGKLLTLGETGKDGANGVGGFGVAKGLLYFCHLSYAIDTGYCGVVGSGGEYSISTFTDARPGTSSCIMVEGDCVEQLLSHARLFCAYAQWGGTFTINGEVYPTALRKGSFRRDLGFAKVWTNNAHPYRVVVRVNGQPMFHQRHEFEKCVVVEVTGSSQEILTSNRDGFRSPYYWQFQDFLQELAVNKRSALKERASTSYTLYDGPFSYSNSRKKAETGEVPVEAGAVLAAAAVETEEVGYDESAASIGKAAALWHVAEDAQQPRLVRKENVREQLRAVIRGPFRMVLKNTTGMAVPSYYQPGSMSHYAESVISWYRACVVTAFSILGEQRSFSVGFLFDEESKGEFESSGTYGSVFYINPVKVVTQSRSGSRSFQKRFRLDAPGRWDIAAVAVHEVVLALGFSGHDEDYAAKLTEVMGIMLQHRADLSAAFRRD